MKSKFALLAVMAAGLVSASASVTLNTQFGIAYNDKNVAVPDGTLWALVVDVNGDGFTGFGVNGNFNATGDLAAFSVGQSLALGASFGDNVIFASGGFNGDAAGAEAGFSLDAVSITYGTNGTAAGRNYAFYWFPGVNYANGTSEVLGSTKSVGGIHSSALDGGTFDTGMTFAADGFAYAVGAATSAGGGTIPNQAFTAVAIPEPSAALLGAIGALGLLRRRRN